MRRPGRLPALALMMVRKGGGYPLRWLKTSFGAKSRIDCLAMSWVYDDDPFRRLQGASRRKEVLLVQLRSCCSLLLGEIWRRVQRTDSTCSCCGEEQDLEHVLRMCPKLESLRRRNFVQVPLPFSVMTTDQVYEARYFREVFNWDLP
jgi:hypothetical protein